MNGGVQSDLYTLAFKNGEQLEDFHIIIIRNQQEINLSRETIYPTIIIFQYNKAFTKSNKLKTIIAFQMTYLITFLDNNVNRLYTQGGIFMDSIVI